MICLGAQHPAPDLGIGQPASPKGTEGQQDLPGLEGALHRYGQAEAAEEGASLGHGEWQPQSGHSQQVQRNVQHGLRLWKRKKDLQKEHKFAAFLACESKISIDFH